MDDLKAYAMNNEQLAKLVDIVKTFSDRIKATFTKVKLTKTSELVLNNDTTIKDLDQEGTCKYFGINEGDE